MPAQTARVSRSAVLILIGSIAVLHVSRTPRFSSFHVVDVIELVAAGVCWGVALGRLAAFARYPRS